MRWIVDAMNVIGSRPDGWWKDRHGAIMRLIDDLERWAAAGEQRVTVVLEQPPAQPLPTVTVEIAAAPRAAANSADDEIVRLVYADTSPQDVTVVTSDATLAERVRIAGASVYSAGGFRRLIDAQTGEQS
ncbi:NYN domain-containing protein [Mycobacterium sp. M1]|uniref:NYN domain-containing protein n=1 Tax=Mycolicibacter acidiphilus TaxID=2835306 RepID=A0ABS5RLU1_9MYCO|nr:NYN domain-containing protein [Mycolicibacter acidiphilus]MBS9535273.1 NYN domain-containing protein [Mycolicibacter acidiphilus]